MGTERPGTRGEETLLLTWRVLPAARSAGRALALLGFLMALMLVLVMATGEGPLAVVLFLAALGSFASFLLPNEYRLTSRGILYKTPVTRILRSWEDFVAFRPYPDGVQLYFDPTRLKGRLQKGLFLFYRGNEDEVLTILKDRVPRQGITPPAGPDGGLPGGRLAEDGRTDGGRADSLRHDGS
ncbi:MAG: hypothetical protein HYY09_05665 [Firmicutes bacterium]|nr:hypothetical protein [Bacillota bacterium]